MNKDSFYITLFGSTGNGAEQIRHLNRLKQVYSNFSIVRTTNYNTSFYFVEIFEEEYLYLKLKYGVTIPEVGEKILSSIPSNISINDILEELRPSNL